MPGLDATIDEASQTIALTQRGAVQHVRMSGPSADEIAVPLTRGGWGAAINYDLSATRADRSTVAGGLLDVVVHGPRGYFHGGAIVTSGAVMGQRGVTRLDTGFIAGSPSTARRLALGDLISGAAEASRPVRMGGVQLATDFDLRPDLVTFPVPAITGAAAVPSALDLIVNGSRRSAGEVRAGQFAVADVPVQSGVNTVTVAVRDALGRETRQTVSTYVSRTLLRPGLHAYSVEAGWLRTGYATAADRYGPFAGSASLRTGLSERLTAEGHLEAGGRVGVGTAGASLGLGAAGLLSAGVGVPSPARRGIAAGRRSLSAMSASAGPSASPRATSGTAAAGTTW